MISDLELRFYKLSYSASRLLVLVRSIIVKTPIEQTKCEPNIKLYDSNLPNQDLLDIELSSWKQKLLDIKLKPFNVATYKLHLANAQKRFLVIRRLCTWLRASLTTKQLSSLAQLTFTVESKLTTKGTVKFLLKV